MLALGVMTRNAAGQIAPCWNHLRRAVPDDVPIVFLDEGSVDGTFVEMAECRVEARADVVRLMRPVADRATAAALVRRQAKCDYVIMLALTDRLRPQALAPFCTWLAQHRPNGAVLAGGWWSLLAPTAPLAARSPSPDQVQPGRARLRALCADPRRLVLDRQVAPALDPFATPGPAWAAWADLVDTTTELMYYPEPVVLRPFPEPSAAPALRAAADRLAQSPAAQRMASFALMAGWLGDALALSPARAALDVADSAQDLWAGMPRDMRLAAADLPGPMGALCAAFLNGEPLSLLSLMATARQEQLVTLLQAHQNTLRDDVDLALPGPDYLRALYARVKLQ